MRRFCCIAISLLVIFGAAAAQEREPQTAADYFNRGNARYDKHDYDGAIADYDKIISLNPKVATVYADRGLAQLIKGRDQAAEQDFNRAIELDATLKPKIEQLANEIKQKRNAQLKP